MRATLYTSSFCGACVAARHVLGRAAELVPALVVETVDIAADPDRTEAAGVTSTPTVTVHRDGDDAEVFRAAGAPTLPQLLDALALALPPARRG